MAVMTKDFVCWCDLCQDLFLSHQFDCVCDDCRAKLDRYRKQKKPTDLHADKS